MSEEFDVSGYVTNCHIVPTKVDPSIMASIRDARAQEVKLLEQRARDVGEALEAAVEASDGATALELENKLRDIETEWKEARLCLSEAQDDYYESHLHSEQTRVLGSARLVSIKEVVILGLIMLVLGLMFYEEMVTVSQATSWRFFWIDTACCVLFMGNFFFEHKLAESKSWYWRTHWIDFFTSIPFPPFFGSADLIRSGRAVRLVRLVRLARLVRIFRVMFFFWRGLDQLTSVLDIRLMKRSLLLCVGVVLLGAFAINQVEGSATPINGGWDSIWWSFTTTVTGGYGDIYNPSSASGRILTVMLVLVGMILIGVFTATLTTILMPEPEFNYDHERHEAFQEEVTTALEAQRAVQLELMEEIRVLRSKIDDGKT
jgi:hypothetical protein